MNALRYSLKRLLTAHRDRKFVVPNYQREYEWETPSEGKKWEEDQKEQERFAAALPEIAKRAEVSGELHLPGIGRLKVRVRVLSGRGVRLVCEPGQ
jgi:hypothetical protein